MAERKWQMKHKLMFHADKISGNHTKDVYGGTSCTEWLCDLLIQFTVTAMKICAHTRQISGDKNGKIEKSTAAIT